MATINTIEPNKSKRTGDVPFTISGTGFLVTDLSSDFSGPVFYSDISVNGSINNTGKLELSVPSTPGSIAGAETNHLFNKAFDVSILSEYEINTLPAVNGSKIIALQTYDDLDPTTYFEVRLEYTDALGYFIRTEAIISGSTVYSKTQSMDPSSVQGLKVIRSGSRFSGYIKISDQFVEMGTYLGYAIFDSRIKFYASNSAVPTSGAFDINITNYNVDTVVSLVNRSAEISSVSATEISGITQSNDSGPGDVIVGLKDGTFAELLSSFEYTIYQGLNRDIKNFDTVLSIYNFHIQPSRHALFTSAGNFIWDDNYWVDPDKQNKNLFIPSLWDATTANVPADYLQSGHGDHSNIELIDIKKYRADSKESWHARLNHGTYFVRNVPYYLYSKESIVSQLGIKTTVDNRSYHPLLFPPKKGIPISASVLTTDIESGLIVDKRRFNKRGRFTGIIQNGVELDTDSPLNIDKTKNEFIVKYNSNNMIVNWKIPTLNATLGLYSFILPEIPLKEYNVIFSRKDIFITKKHLGSFYGDPETVYNEIYYGEPLENDGDYAINYSTGEVQVLLDQDYLDLGYVTFTFDYPAIIEFNDNYLVDYGSSLTNPTASQLSLLSEVDTSNGAPFQILRLKEFPVLDFSRHELLDLDNFRLFLYDESDNTYETDWTRVTDIRDAGPSDKVYQLNPDQGLIFFGDNITGKIPQKYKKIVAGYKTTVRIEYEPESSVDYWIGEETDLNLSRNNLNSGFLYLSRKDLVPDNISIRFSVDEITALEYAELIAVVRDRDGDPVPNAPLTFEIVNGDGSLEEESLITNSNGEARTTFVPSGNILDMAIFTQLFESGVDPDTVGAPLTNVYFSSGLLVNNTIVADEDIVDLPSEVFLFKVYDDGDQFNQYNNETRTGGSYYVYHDFSNDTLQNELIKPVAISGKVLIFNRSLPQPYSPSDPFYEPNLRGFAIIGKKRVQAKAIVDAGLFDIDSDIASIKISYSPIQKGEWTLPIPPTNYIGSEIDRATYITINP